MRIKLRSIVKFVCAAFIVYYTWLRIIIPGIEGYLLPFGMIMMGTIIVYMIVNHTNMAKVLVFPIVSWIIFCIVEYIAAAFVAVNVSFAQSSVLTFMELVIMCFAMVFVAKLEGNAELLMKLMYFTCAGYVFSMLIRNNHIMGRLALVNANGDANVCLIGIVTATMIIDLRKSIQSISIMLTVYVMFYANIMTGSRKSFICTMFYLFFWFIVFAKTDWKIISAKKKREILIGLVFFFAVFLRFVIPVIMNSPTMLRLIRGSEQGDSLRVFFYREAWRHFKNHPILGIGYNQFRLYNRRGYYAHSTYAELIADGGIVGSSLFFAPHVWCIANLITIIKKYTYGKNYEEMKKALLLLIYMVSSLLLAAGMVQTSNERVLMMYAAMFAYIICDKSKETPANRRYELNG